MICTTDHELIVTLRRMNAETEKFVAEQRKLIAEADKFNRDRWPMILTPIFLSVAAIGAWLSVYLQLQH